MFCDGGSIQSESTRFQPQFVLSRHPKSASWQDRILNHTLSLRNQLLSTGQQDCTGPWHSSPERGGGSFVERTFVPPGHLPTVRNAHSISILRCFWGPGPRFVCSQSFPSKSRLTTTYKVPKSSFRMPSQHISVQRLPGFPSVIGSSSERKKITCPHPGRSLHFLEASSFNQPRRWRYRRLSRGISAISCSNCGSHRE